MTPRGRYPRPWRTSHRVRVTAAKARATALDNAARATVPAEPSPPAPAPAQELDQLAAAARTAEAEAHEIEQRAAEARARADTARRAVEEHIRAELRAAISQPPCNRCKEPIPPATARPCPRGGWCHPHIRHRSQEPTT